MPSKRPPKVQPRTLKTRAADEKKKAVDAKIKRTGEQLELHDPANLRKRKGAQRELRHGEKLNPGRITKDGRKGARVIAPLTVHLDAERRRALKQHAYELGEKLGRRVYESQVIAAALSRLGVGGPLAEAERA